MVFDSKSGTYKEGKIYKLNERHYDDGRGCQVLHLGVIRKLTEEVILNPGGFRILNTHHVLRVKVCHV